MSPASAVCALPNLDLGELIGATLADARARATGDGYAWQVAIVDGRQRDVSGPDREDRVTVEVAHGRVIAARLA